MPTIMVALAPEELVKVIYKEQTQLILDPYPKYISMPFTVYFYCKKERPELSLQPVGCRPPSLTYCVNYERVYAPYTFLGGKVIAKCVIESADGLITQLEVFNPAKELNEFESYRLWGRHKTGAPIRDWLPMKKMSKTWVYVQEGKNKN